MKTIILTIILAFAAFGQSHIREERRGSESVENLFDIKPTSSITLKHSYSNSITFHSLGFGDVLMTFQPGQVLKNATTGTCVHWRKHDDYRVDLRRVPCPDWPMVKAINEALQGDYGFAWTAPAALTGRKEKK